MDPKGDQSAQQVAEKAWGLSVGRCLRNHFEEKVDQFCLENGHDTEGGKRALEYLFAAEDPQLAGELHRMTEFGLRDVEELEEMGLGDSVQLCNSLTFVEPLAKAKVNT